MQDGHRTEWEPCQGNGILRGPALENGLEALENGVRVASAQSRGYH